MLIAHFILEVGTRARVIPVQSVSDLHDLTEASSDPEIRQSVVIRRAVSSDRFFYDWYRNTKLGKDTAAPVTVRLLAGPGGKPVLSWRVEAARPIRWTGPRFDGLGNELAMETLELSYTGIIWLDT
ncbi:MAG: phage tail protein [Granulosicoccus sp.]|nr:phage tail protein [Granulosicoccus sp.]